MQYDFLIVGAGIAGATCARLLTDKGYKCLIIEERPFVGGMCVTTNVNGIDIHVLGPHVFHTNDKKIWDFVNQYSEFNNYRLKELTFTDYRFYHSRLNLELLQDIYGNDKWPQDYEKLLKEDLVKFDNISNAEEYCLSIFGKKIYETTLKGYYEKIYNDECKNLSKNIITDNINCNFVLNNETYSDKYQGVPKIGYTLMIEKIIGNDIDIMLNTQFLPNYNKLKNYCKSIIYTGEIDKLFNYCIGTLDWTCANITMKDENLDSFNVTGNPIIRFPDDKIPWYRTIEHKWFREDLSDTLMFKNNTYVTYEEYKEWKIGDNTFFVKHTNLSLNKYRQYLDYVEKKYPNMILCGAKAEYKNMSMAETIKSAMNICSNL